MQNCLAQILRCSTDCFCHKMSKIKKFRNLPVYVKENHNEVYLYAEVTIVLPLKSGGGVGARGEGGGGGGAGKAVARKTRRKKKRKRLGVRYVFLSLPILTAAGRIRPSTTLP